MLRHDRHARRRRGRGASGGQRRREPAALRDRARATSSGSSRRSRTPARARRDLPLAHAHGAAARRRPTSTSPSSGGYRRGPACLRDRRPRRRREPTCARWIAASPAARSSEPARLIDVEACIRAARLPALRDQPPARRALLPALRDAARLRRRARGCEAPVTDRQRARAQDQAAVRRGRARARRGRRATRPRPSSSRGCCWRRACRACCAARRASTCRTSSPPGRATCSCPASGAATARDVLLETEPGPAGGAGPAASPGRLLAALLAGVAVIAIIAWLGTDVLA